MITTQKLWSYYCFSKVQLVTESFGSVQCIKIILIGQLINQNCVRVIICKAHSKRRSIILHVPPSKEHNIGC